MMIVEAEGDENDMVFKYSEIVRLHKNCIYVLNTVSLFYQGTSLGKETDLIKL